MARLIVFSLAFLLLAALAVSGLSDPFDSTVLSLLRRDADGRFAPIGPPWLHELARDITSLGSSVLLLTAATMVIGLLLIVHRKRDALWLACNSLGVFIFSNLLKFIFSRPRPDLFGGTQVFTSSFPSSHAAQSLVICFSIIWLGQRSTATHLLKNCMSLYAFALVGIIGLSRIYLGVHYPTDVFAGWLFGAAWLILSQMIYRRVIGNPKSEPS